MEILNKEIRICDSITDDVVACITYKEDGKEKYLINVCVIDGMLLPVYYITDNKRLFEFESTPWAKIGEGERRLMEQLEKEARRPETEEQTELAMISYDMIKEKCREFHLMDDEALFEDSTLW